jgi:hypothetical protein
MFRVKGKTIFGGRGEITYWIQIDKHKDQTGIPEGSGQEKKQRDGHQGGSMLKTRVAVPFHLLIGYTDKFCTVE